MRIPASNKASEHHQDGDDVMNYQTYIQHLAYLLKVQIDVDYMRAYYAKRGINYAPLYNPLSERLPVARQRAIATIPL